MPYHAELSNHDIKQEILRERLRLENWRGPSCLATRKSRFHIEAYEAELRRRDHARLVEHDALQAKLAKDRANRVHEHNMRAIASPRTQEIIKGVKQDMQSALDGLRRVSLRGDVGQIARHLREGLEAIEAAEAEALGGKVAA